MTCARRCSIRESFQSLHHKTLGGTSYSTKGLFSLEEPNTVPSSGEQLFSLYTLTDFG